MLGQITTRQDMLAQSHMVVTQRNFFFAYGPLQFIGNLGDFITAAPVNANDQISIARILGPLQRPQQAAQ
jgi:hypothetical protein